MRPKRSRAETIARNRLDRQIAEIYHARCQGWGINVLDIAQVFEAGYATAAAGGSVEAAVVEVATRLRVAS